MDYFTYRGGSLYCESLSVENIAQEVGTPFYLYSKKTFIRHYRKLDSSLRSFDHLICYALKANPNLSILKALALEGCGAEVVSGGELYKALKAGIPSEKIVFNGNGKTMEELEYALRSDILMFNVDNEGELENLQKLAKKIKKKARVALRVNPAIDPLTHPHIATGLAKSKFGFPMEKALEGYRWARSKSNLEVVGIHHHIGSQITQLSPFVESLERILELLSSLEGEKIHIKYLDIGGGLGIPYEQDEQTPSFDLYAQAISPAVKKAGCTLIVEPGRVIMGNAGILVTKVLQVKKTPSKTFVVVDAAMNDLIRPSFYNAYHRIVPITKSREHGEMVADVVGGICESGDFFARERRLPLVKPNDLLAIMGVGAYGFSMASNYNSRPRSPEVMVSNGRYKCIRRKETYEDMVKLEEEV